MKHIITKNRTHNTNTIQQMWKTWYNPINYYFIEL